tara:strand:+ start:387 stop:569 length:183 start_codon:yes stop_codon:yes gene_type:complete
MSSADIRNDTIYVVEDLAGKITHSIYAPQNEKGVRAKLIIGDEDMFALFQELKKHFGEKE